MIRSTTLIALAHLCAVPAVALTPVCYPADGNARVLQSANPHDIHQDWRGESPIGTTWSLIEVRRVNKDGVEYLRGILVSPRGGSMGQIYALRAEWECR